MKSQRGGETLLSVTKSSLHPKSSKQSWCISEDCCSQKQLHGAIASLPVSQVESVLSTAHFKRLKRKRDLEFP